MTDGTRWRIELSSKAQRQFDSLQKDAALRIWDFLHNKVSPAKDPKRLGKKLEGARDIWRYRVGSFRILVTLRSESLIVLVLEVGDRGRVYKRRR